MTREEDLQSADDRALDSVSALSPLIGLSVNDLARAGLAVVKQAVLQPSIGVEHAARLLAENVRIITGSSEVAPHPKDRRFADEAYSDNPLYRRLGQSWAALQRGLDQWVDDVGFDDDDRERARFVTQQIADALAPTNFLAGNPSALRRARETRGISLVKGVRNIIDDLMHNGCMPRQVDSAPFKVGENLANTPGQVVFEHPIAELIQYTPATEHVRSRPLLFVPPQINKFYVYDISPEKSVVRYLVEKGFQVFMLSWRNPTAEERDWGLAEYIEAIDEAMKVTCAITGQQKIDTVGACAGGITLTAALCYIGALGHADRAASLTLMVNVLNTHREDTVANLFFGDDVIESSRKRSARKGLLEGKDTARIFSWMRPNDLIWNYVASNYLHGDKPPAFDVLYWNSDSTNLPARLHSDFLNIFKKSPFANPGTMLIRDIELDIDNVKCPVFITGGTTDHITPWQACYRSTQLFKGETTYVLSTAGHIQSFVNPPGNPRRRYLVNASTPTDPEEWLRGAEEHDGSWWPYWTDWLKTLSQRERKAPAKQGNKDYPVIRPAPGLYVLG